MAIKWKLLAEIPGHEWIEGYRIGYDDTTPESGFVLQSCRERAYIRGVEGAVSSLSDTWHTIKLCPGVAGYLQAGVYTGKRRKTVQVHHTGYLAFGPARPSPRHWVLHRNDDKRCNTLENLYWGIAKQNNRDMVLNGHRVTRLGDTLPQSKITEEIARDIYRRAWAGESQRSLASELGISQPNISMIKHKKSWKHIHKDEG